MKIFLLFAILAYCFIQTNAYGTILTDTVLPVKESTTYIDKITSESIDTTTLDVGTLSISDPDGITISVPTTAEISGNSIEFTGETGLFIGGDDADSVNINANSFTATGEDIDFNVENSFEVRTNGDISLSSGTETYIQADRIDLEGIFGWEIESYSANVEVNAGIEIAIQTDELELSGQENLDIESVTGDVSVNSQEIVNMLAKVVNMESLMEAQLIAEEGITIQPAQTLRVSGGRNEVTSIRDLVVNTEQEAHFDSEDTILMQGQDDIFFIGDVMNMRTSGSENSDLVMRTVDDVEFDTDIFSVRAKDIVVETSEFLAEGEGEFRLASESRTRLVANDQLDIQVTDLTLESLGQDFDVIAEDSITVETTNEVDDVTINSSGDFRVTIEEDFSVDTNAVLDFRANEYNIIGTGEILVTADYINFLADEQTIEARNLHMLSEDTSTYTANNINSNYEDNVWYESLDNDLQISGVSGRVIGSTIESSAWRQMNIDSLILNINSVMDTTFRSDIKNFEINIDDDMAMSVLGDVHMLGNGYFRLDVDESFSVNGDETTIRSGNNMYIDANTINFSDASDIVISTNGGATFTQDDLQIIGSVNINAGSADISSESFNIIGSKVGFEANHGTINFFTSESVDLEDGNIYADSARDFYFHVDSTISMTSKTTNIYSDEGTVMYHTSDSPIDVQSFSGNIDFNVDGEILFNHDAGLGINAETGLYIATDLNENDMIHFDIGSEISATASGNIDFVSNGEFSFHSEANLDFETDIGDITINAMGDGKRAYFRCIDDMDWGVGNDMKITSSELNIQSTDDINNNDISFESLTDGNNIQVTVGEEAVWNNINLITVESNSLVMTASNIEFGDSDYSFNEENRQTFTSPNLDYSAGNEINVISNRDIVYNVEGSVTSTFDNHRFAAYRNTRFVTEELMSFNATGNEEYKFQSWGGNHHIEAVTGDIFFRSSQDTKIAGGRTNSFYSKNEGLNMTINEGDTLFQSAGSIQFESKEEMDIDVTQFNNEDGQSNINFNVQSHMSIISDRGTNFKSYGINDATNNGIELMSSGEHSTILFESLYGDIIENNQDELQLLSQEEFHAYAINDILLTAKEDNFEINVDQGETVIFGGDGIIFQGSSPGNLFDQTWNVGNSITGESSDTITFESTGPIDLGVAIDISSENGDINFITGTGRNITMIASDELQFDSDNDFVMDSNQDLRFVIENGGFQSSADGTIDFTTNTGNMVLTTLSGNTDDTQVLFQAENGNIDIASGWKFTHDSDNEILMNSETGLDISALDGSMFFVAEESDSLITFEATEDLIFTSTGTRNNKEIDQIYLEAANNIEYSSENDMRINTLDSVTFGDSTRPVIEVNAGGDESTAGVQFSSDGNIRSETDNIFNWDITDTLNINGESSFSANTAGPILVQTKGSDENILITAEDGSIYFYGENTLTATSTANSNNDNIGITSRTNGIFSFISKGLLPEDRIEFSAQLDIDIDVDDSTIFSTNVLDTDQTDSINFETVNSGKFETLNRNGASIDMNIDNTFTATIAKGVGFSVNTELTDAPLTIETQGDNSSVNIKTAQNSNFLLNAGNRLVLGAALETTISTENSGDIEFLADNSQSNDDAVKGDINAYSTGSISGNANRNFDIESQDSIIISTLGDNENGVGYPINILSTGNIFFDTITTSADDSFTIANRFDNNVVGTINFLSAHDIDISTVNGDINFDVSGDISYSSYEDLTFNYQNNYYHYVQGNSVFTANGSVSNNNYGLLIEREGNVANDNAFSISAHPHASVELRGNTGVTLSDQLSSGSNPSSVDFDFSRSTIFRSYGALSGPGTNSEGIIIQNTANSISFTAEQHVININGEDGIIFDANTNNININSNGFDPEMIYAMKFHSTSPLNSDDISIDSENIVRFESNEIRGYSEHLTVNAANNVQINADGYRSRVEFESTGNMEFESETDVQINGINVDFISNGAIRGNSSNEINFIISNDMIIRTTESAVDSRILFDAAATNDFSAVDTIYVQTTASETDSAVIFQSDQGAINIESRGTLEFRATEKDVTFDLEFEGDFQLISSSSLNFNCSGDITIEAQADNVQSMDLNAVNFINLESDEFITFNSDDNLDFNFANSLFITSAIEANHADGNQFGDIVFDSFDDVIFLASAGDINLETSIYGDILLDCDSTNDDDCSIIFDTTAVVFNDDAHVLIPHRVLLDRTPGGGCIPGEIMIFNQLDVFGGATLPQADVYLCVCSDGNNFQCARETELHD